MKDHHEHKTGAHTKSVLLLAAGVSSTVFIVELLGGFWTHSLALLSDSTHNFMDMISFILSFFAILLAERPISDTRTFGWHRLEVFAALINSLTVSFIACAIFIQAFKRLANPTEILGQEMLSIACFGLIANLFVIWKLHPHVGMDVNIRSAFLHAFGDAVSSLAVVSGGALVLITKNHAIDPIAASAVAFIILLSAGVVLKDSFHILLEGAPKGLERNLILKSIEEIVGNESVKDLHIWNLCSHICALSVHLILPETRMNQQKNILEEINLNLEKKFNIVHTTIQIESEQWMKEKIEKRRPL